LGGEKGQKEGLKRETGVTQMSARRDGVRFAQTQDKAHSFLQALGLELTKQEVKAEG